jgi:dipeptidyl aminopeptidase/acylaminoacyl peptidase
VTTTNPTTRRALVVDDLYALAFVSDPQLAPDGSRVSYVVTRADEASDENRAAIWLADVALGAERQLTNGPADAHPRWTPDGSALLFIRRGEHNKPQVWRLPLAGGEPRQVTSIATGVSQFVLSPDGTRIAFTSGVDIEGEFTDDEQKKRAAAPVVIDRLGYKADGAGLVRSRRSHLFVVDIHDNAALRQLTSGNYSVGSPAWSPAGTHLAYSASMRDDRDVNPGSAIYTVAIDGGEPRARTTDAGAAAAPIWLSPSRILFAGKPDNAAGHARLFTIEVDVDSNVDTNALAGPAEFTPGFDRNVMLGAPAYPGSIPRLTDTHVIFCARDRGCTHIYRVARDGGTPQRVVGTPDTTASAISVSAGGERIAYIGASPTSPGEVHVAAADGTNAIAVTDVASALRDVDLAIPQERVFTAPDGVEVHGWMLRRAPAGAGAVTPSPMLLDVHGGPHNAWNPVFDGIHLYHQVLAAQGWTILYVNPRGSDGYGEEFFTAVVDEWGTADLDDFLTPIQALVDEGIADPGRLAVTGYSYGGFITCWLTGRTDRFAAAVTGGCVSNQLSLFGTSDLGWYLGVLEVGGTPADPKKLHEHSPITYVGAVTAPTLVLHGEADDRCPIEQAEQWFAALRSQGVVTEMVRYPGASHIFIALGRPSHRVDYNRRVVDWLNQHISNS